MWKSAIVVCLTWKVLFKIIKLICYQSTPPMLQHAHAVTGKNQNENNKYLSESLVYKAAVSQTLSQISKFYYGTVQKSYCHI